MNAAFGAEPDDLDEARGHLADMLADAVAGRRADGEGAQASEGSHAAGLAPQETEALARAARLLEASLALSSAEVAALLALDGERAPEPARPALPEDYEILEEIGRGGMGVVYRARRRSQGRVVAVKVLRPGDLLFGQSLQRFEREARVLARMRHPNIVGVHEVGEHDGRLYLAMDLVEGRSLGHVLKDGALTPARAVGLLKQVAAAVAYVHAHGLVHRDLKPGNILVDADDRVFVMDFGLALEVGSDDGLTLTGQVVGTPGYMSPEQARGDLAAVGEPTDIHALGVLLYECITGVRPFRDLSPAEQVYAVIHREPQAMRRLQAAAPRALEAIAAQAMRKRPAERYPSARAFLEDLERFEEGRSTRAQPRSRAYRLGRFLGAHRVALAAGAAALVALVGVYALAGGFGLRRPQTVLLDMAADLRARGNPEGAVLLYEEARRQDLRVADPALDLALTAARVDRAQQLWEQGRLEDAAALLEAAVAEGKARYDLYGKQPLGGPLYWALGTVRGLEGRWGEADQTFNEARQRHGWSEDETLAWLAERTFGSNGGSPNAWVFARFGAALREPSDPSRKALLVMLGSLGLWRSSQPFALASRQEPPTGCTLADLLAAWMEGALLRVEAGYPHPSIGFGWIRNALEGEDDAPLAEALVALARDGARPEKVRNIAAAFLADRLDLPAEAARGSTGTDWGTDDAAPVLAALAELEPLDAAARLQARLERAVALMRAASDSEAPGPPSAHRVHPGQLEEWFQPRAGVPHEVPVGQLLAWWEGAREEAPARRLARRLGLTAAPALEEIQPLLKRMARAPNSEQQVIHQLLTLIVPRSYPLLTPRSVQRDGGAAQVYWLTRLGRVEGPQRVRMARVLLEPAGPRLDSAYDHVQDASVDGVFKLRHEVPLGITHGPSTRVGFPPARSAVSATAASLELTLRIEPHAGGSVVRLLQRVERRPGGMSSSSGGNNLVHVGFVMAPNVAPGSWSNPDPDRLELALALLEPDTGPAEPWTLAGWVGRVTADIERLADEAEACESRALEQRASWDPTPIINRYLYDHQETLTRSLSIAVRLPLPGARDALRRLLAVTGRGSHLSIQRNLIVLALLMAGDEERLGDATVAAYVEGRGPIESSRDDPHSPPARSFDDSYAMTTAGRDGEYWARLLAYSPSEPIRALATRRLELEALSDRAAGDLLAAQRLGRVRLSDALARRVGEGPTEDLSWWGQVKTLAWVCLPVGLVWLATLLCVALLLRPVRARWQRLRPAGWLIVLGGASGCVDVVAAGQDLLPDDLGLALMACGALVLGGHVRGWLRRGPALVFALAAMLMAGARLWALPVSISGLPALLAAVGIGLLPLLARALAGERPRPPSAAEGALPDLFRPSFGWVWIRVAAVCLLLGAMALFVGGPHGKRGVSAASIALVMVPLVVGLLWGLARVLARWPRRGWPVPFLLLYVLPVAATAVAALVAFLGGPAWGLTLNGDWVPLLMIVFGGCVLWALLIPLAGAGIRRAYLRLVASRLQAAS